MGVRFDAKSGKYIDTVTGKTVGTWKNPPGSTSTSTTGNPITDNNIFAKQQADALGVTMALVKMFPELNVAWDYYLKKDYGKFREAVLNSSFYKNNNSTARDRLTAKAQQPGVYEQQYQDYLLGLKKRLIGAGVRLDDSTLASIAKTAFDSGMSENQVDQLALQHTGNKQLGGSTLGTIGSLKAYERSFGVQHSDAYWSAKSKDLFAGNTTSEDIQKEIRDLSASTYPAYADGIVAGKSMDEQGSNIVNAISTYLEVDPDTISWDHPLAKQMAQWINPATGKQERMPNWQVEKTVKSTPDWLKTKNAISTFDSFTTRIFGDILGGY